MTISSITASMPVSAPVSAADPSTNSATNTPDPQNDNNDAGAAQPPVQAPLPPGQGTRIDQMA